MDTLNDPRVSSAVEAYFEAITAGDEQGWIGLFAADCVVHDPVGAIPAEGRESLPGVWRILRVPFESVAMEAVDVFHGGKIQTLMSYWDPAEMMIAIAG
jgi:ketosteroid isomerase-like protein